MSAEALDVERGTRRPQPEIFQIPIKLLQAFVAAESKSGKDAECHSRRRATSA
jgi:hypothetical protein